MPITLITGPANAGKAELVMDALRRQLAHGREPLLIVPTRADVEHYRRELAGDGAVMGAEVERFRELIARAVRCAGEGAPVLGAVAREQLLAALALREGAGLSPAGASAASARALASFIGELQERRATSCCPRAPSPTRRAHASRSGTSSARCSSRIRGARTPPAPCGCSRAPTSAPS